jgi:hypothetical protein
MEETQELCQVEAGEGDYLKETRSERSIDHRVRPHSEMAIKKMSEYAWIEG